MARTPSAPATTAARGHGPAAGRREAPYRFLADPVHQYLLRTGRTSFRGLAFGDLRRLALDIEVVDRARLRVPERRPRGGSHRRHRPGRLDRVEHRAVGRASWARPSSCAECGAARCASATPTSSRATTSSGSTSSTSRRARGVTRVPLAWGRDGSALRGHPSRMQVAERTIAYRRYGVAGRHIVDTWILAQLYDVAARDLDVLWAQGRGAALRRGRARPDLPAPRGHPARVRARTPRGSWPTRATTCWRRSRSPPSCSARTSCRRRPCPSTTSRSCSAATRPRSTPCSCASTSTAARPCPAPGRRTRAWPAATPRCSTRAWPATSSTST